MKKIKVPLTQKGIDNLIKEIRAYQKWLTDCTKQFIDELGKQGVDVASAKFDKAVYDGSKDVSVHVETRENGIAIVAIGQSVLFIEFGTGVRYADNHPQKPAGIAARGTYGKGHGKQQTWGFNGEDLGSNGKFATVRTKNGDIAEKIPHIVLTHGNPANASMYNTIKDIKEIFYQTAKRVYVR